VRISSKYQVHPIHLSSAFHYLWERFAIAKTVGFGSYVRADPVRLQGEEEVRSKTIATWSAESQMKWVHDKKSEESSMLYIQPIVALIAGILILVMPRLLNYVVAIYLIVIGILGLAH
jgi:hypothetical protein